MMKRLRIVLIGLTIGYISAAIIGGIPFLLAYKMWVGK